jgi:phospholipid-binding lipoprotein MlaA
MSIGSLLRAAGVLSLALGLGACVTLPPNAPRSKADPWERFNRGVYKFNDSIDRHVAKPVAKRYVKVVPQPIRTGVNNFFTNLHTPTVMVNDALQAQFLKAGADLGRFLMNTIVGIGGILDPATSAGLDRNDNDFGRTLGHWGLHSGPFVELPLFGPSDVRDTFGKAADVFTNPQHWVTNNAVDYGLYLPDLINKRAQLLPLDETLQNAFDPYAFIRDAYLANRAYLTGQTKASDELPLDEPLEDPEAPGTAAPGAAAPGAAAPGGAAPGTAAPGTAAPGTAAPGAAPSPGEPLPQSPP